MRLFSALFFVICLALSGSRLQAQEQKNKQAIEVADAYFAVDGHKPIHLTHKPIEVYRVRLGDEFSLWADLKLVDGAVSPCNDREEKACELYWEIQGEKRTWKVWEGRMRFRMTDSVNIAITGAISRSSDYGPAVVRMIISKEDQHVFTLDISIEIK